MAFSDPKRKKEYHKAYHAAHRDHARRYAKEFRERNPDYYQKWKKLNPDYTARYWEKNKDRKRVQLRDYLRNRRAHDENFRLRGALRCRLRSVMRGKGKRLSALLLLGCSIEDFFIYLESKFEPGMTRENYGSVWQVDHIMPCAVFDLSKSEHQKRCFHFSNLQPLFSEENQKKSDNVLSDQFQLL